MADIAFGWKDYSISREEDKGKSIRGAMRDRFPAEKLLEAIETLYKQEEDANEGLLASYLRLFTHLYVDDDYYLQV